MRVAPSLQLLGLAQLGAHVRNENVPRALALVAFDLRARVVPQCGVSMSSRASTVPSVVSTPKSSRLSTLPRSLRKADVVFVARVQYRIRACRGGVASVLVPLSFDDVASARQADSGR